MALLVAIGTLSGCDGAPENDGGDHSSDLKPVMELTREDRRVTSDNAKEISLDAAAEEVLITDGGDYRLRGHLNGTVRIRAEDQIVHLFFGGVEIQSVTAPAVDVESAGKVVITVEPGSVNSLSDGSKYLGDGSDACLFSACDLTVNGSGSLSVSGYCKDAVHSRDYLKIAGVTLFVRARDDGLHGNDGVLITQADVSVEAEKNGVRATKTGKPLKGRIEITGTKLSVIAGEHALNASRSIYMDSSRAFLKGVMSNTKADGEIYIAEGCLTNG